MENIYQMGIVIREYRKKLGITQKQLAERLGVSDKAVSKWERCESLPDVTLIPKISSALDVSIEYLMTGAEKQPYNDRQADNISDVQSKNSNACDSKNADREKGDAENVQIVSSAAKVMHSKISTRYTVCICILFFVLLSGLFEIILFGASRMVFYDIICAVMSIAVFAVFYMHCRTKTIMLESMGAKYTAGLGTAAALTVAGNVIILLFLGMQTKGANSLMDDLLGHTFANMENNILYGSAGYGWIVAMVLLFVVVLTNLILSKDKSFFSKNVAAVFAGGVAMCVAHRLFFEFIEQYIVSQEQFLYTFYLERKPAMTIIANIEKYTLIYFALLAVFGIAVGVLFSRGVKQRLVTAAIMTVFAVYLYICAYKFLGFEAYGNYYAQLTPYGFKGSVFAAAVLPHIVMILNRFTENTI